MGVRSLPFFKRKNGLQFAGIGQDTSGGGGEHYVLPVATASTLGGVKVGYGVSVDPSTGVLSVTLQTATLPTASADLVDVVLQYVGATDTYTNGYFYKCVSDGLDPATYSWVQTNVQPQYTLPTASESTLGGVKVGSNLSIDANGVLSASGGGMSVASNAGAHNSIYRGQYLGSSVTSEQYDEIQDGTFNGLFIGDYWTIDNVNYRIAAFDYWLHTGYTECVDHHVVLVPDTNFTGQSMNDSSVTTGGYLGSKMYTTYLNDAKTAIETAFTSAHILSHKELLTKTVTNGIATAWQEVSSTVELMSEVMVYGCINAGKPAADGINFNIGYSKTQLPIFAMEPSRISNRVAWWLRSVGSDTTFSIVNFDGTASTYNAVSAIGVRPVFAIYKPTV